MPDRLLHHSTVVSIQGEDYRLKDKRRACLREYPFLPDERHPSPWATPMDRRQIDDELGRALKLTQEAKGRAAAFLR